MGNDCKDDVKRNAARGINNLISGSLIARLVAISSLYVITLIYTPFQLGQYNEIWAYANIIGSIISFRMGVAIIRSKDDNQRFELLSSGIALILIVASFLIIVSLTIFSTSAYAALCICIGAIVIALNDTVTSFIVSRRDYRTVAKAGVAQSVIGETIKVSAGLYNFFGGLIAGQVFGYVVSIFCCLWRGRLCTEGKFWKTIKIRKTVRDNIDIMTTRTIAHVLMMIGIQMPVLYASLTQDISIVGKLGIALAAVSIPFSILGQSASKVFYSEVSRLDGNREMMLSLMVSVIKRQLLIGFIIAIIGFAAGEFMGRVLLSEEWEYSGKLASILCLSIPFQLAAGSVVEVANIISTQKFFLLLYIKRIIIVAIFVAPVHLISGSLEYMLYAYVLALSTHFITNLIASIRLVKRGM